MTVDYLGELVQNTARNITVAPGPPYASGNTYVVFISKNGGSFASISPTQTDLGSGWYNFALASGNTDTTGDLAFRMTATGAADDYYAKGVVIGINPFATVINTNVVNWAGFAAATTQNAVSTTAGGSSATNVNVIQWNGLTVATTMEAVATSINVNAWAGFAAATTQLPVFGTSVLTGATNVNVVSWAGFNTATTQLAIFPTSVVTGATNVNVVGWAGFTTATTQEAIATSINVNAWAGFAAATTQLAIFPTSIISGATNVNVVSWAGFSAATTQLPVNTLSDIWNFAVDGTTTAAQSLELNNGAQAGLLSGASGSSIIIRNLGNTKNLITASGDSFGNRNVITLNL